WESCLDRLSGNFSEDEIRTWLRPLHGSVENGELKLLAPNRYVLSYVKANLLGQLEEAVANQDNGINKVDLRIGSHSMEDPGFNPKGNPETISPNQDAPYSGGALNADYTFQTHVEGQSNQLARAAAMQVGKSPGTAFNPLFIYGGVGLGKTHLMQAAGNKIVEQNPRARVVYVHSEIFVNDMVKALKNNTMNEFKRYYRSMDALLIDDIQFFARKTQSQEEFFHTFNALLEGQRQIIITSDRIPKAINHVEERLISRFGSGLTVS
ncbi:MAG: ATP-binding protein, partial [Nitrospinaceae bacterium]|nr:ATP-binding protein [Nitrospinaceae bacterium]